MRIYLLLLLLLGLLVLRNTLLYPTYQTFSFPKLQERTRRALTARPILSRMRYSLNDLTTDEEDSSKTTTTSSTTFYDAIDHDDDTTYYTPPDQALSQATPTTTINHNIHDDAPITQTNTSLAIPIPFPDEITFPTNLQDPPSPSCLRSITTTTTSPSSLPAIHTTTTLPTTATPSAPTTTTVSNITTPTRPDPPALHRRPDPPTAPSTYITLTPQLDALITADDTAHATPTNATNHLTDTLTATAHNEAAQHLYRIIVQDIAPRSPDADMPDHTTDPDSDTEMPDATFDITLPPIRPPRDPPATAPDRHYPCPITEQDPDSPPPTTSLRPLLPAPFNLDKPPLPQQPFHQRHNYATVINRRILQPLWRKQPVPLFGKTKVSPLPGPTVPLFGKTNISPLPGPMATPPKQCAQRPTLPTPALVTPSQPETPQTKPSKARTPPCIKLATYNIMDGRNSRLTLLLRNLQTQNIDLCIATETKFPPGPDGTPGIHTRQNLGYDIFATYTNVTNQGGIALITRTDSKNWHVESTQRHGPNVLSCILVSGTQHTPLIGVYLAPSHLNDLPHLEEALERFRNHKRQPLLLGDLNVDLSDMSTSRTTKVAATISAYGLEDLLLHFRPERRYTHLQTYFSRRQGKTVRSRVDYILGTDRRLFKSIKMRKPRHFTSDHYMLIGKFLTMPAKVHKGYLRGRKAFPLKSDPDPCSPQDALFATLKKQTTPPPPATKKTRPHWITAPTLKAMDQRCSLRRHAAHCRAEARRLTRLVNSCLKADRKLRTEEAGAAIQAALDSDDPKTAYGHLAAWYKFHGDRTPKPSRQDLESVTRDFATLYTAEVPSPPGDDVPYDGPTFAIDDSVPSEAEIEDAIPRIKLGKASGPSGMKAEDFHEWLADARRKENPDTTRWLALVATIQHIFKTGNVPKEVCWTLLALLPKPDGGVRGIGLLEVTWKLCEAIIDTRVKQVVKLHDCIHGFTAHRGTGTAIIEAKLQQELASIRSQPLFQVFLDLKKAYDTLDRPRVLQTCKDYGMGPQLRQVLKSFWDQQQIVARQSGFHGPAFSAERGITQGGLFGPMLFNMEEDKVIRHWLSLALPADNTASDNGLGSTVKEKLVAFYADDGLLSATDSDWLQRALDILIGLFRRVGLSTNVSKSKMMACYPGYYPTKLSDKAYQRTTTGKGLTFKETRKSRISCPECDKDLAQGSLKGHLRAVHGIEPPPGPWTPTLLRHPLSGP